MEAQGNSFFINYYPRKIWIIRNYFVYLQNKKFPKQFKMAFFREGIQNLNSNHIKSVVEKDIIDLGNKIELFKLLTLLLLLLLTFTWIY